MEALSILVVTGGVGHSAERLVRTALAQFPDAHVSLTIKPGIRTAAEIDQAVGEACVSNSLLVHTLVDRELRNRLIDVANSDKVSEVDLIGPVMRYLQANLLTEPLGEPGLYRKLREHDLRRIEAIEYAVDHDDGKRIQDLASAEIVLVGVSRVGKTPLSIYLSTMGWKVANVPLIKDLEPPAELFSIDNRRVVGLFIDAGQLVAYRKRRQSHLGTTSESAYTAPQELVDELDFARQVFRRGQFAIVNTTDSPIEESGHEIIRIVTQKLK
ncbi:MAG: kinase/pyrophosphorylase [Anaerolineae bacterium]|nr:kinase/pyrophosphorylase [Anaerolineae bacterium]